MDINIYPCLRPILAIVHYMFVSIVQDNFDALVQGCSISIALDLELQIIDYFLTIARLKTKSCQTPH